MYRKMLDEKYDSERVIKLDATCSRDPDMVPSTGVFDQGLEFTIECHRACQTAPVHDNSDRFKFIAWDEVTNPLSTTCNSTDSEGQDINPLGCFRPSIHISGPLTYLTASNWKDTVNYPIKQVTELDKVEIFLFLLTEYNKLL